MLQFWEYLQSAAASLVGVHFTLDPVGLVQARLQLLGTVARLGIAPALGGPLRALDHAVVLGAARPDGMHPHRQAGQP
jgi:hypothetical protein